MCVGYNGVIPILDHYTLHANAFFELCVFFSYMHRGRCNVGLTPPL